MKIIGATEATAQMNHYGQSRTPFLFVISFDCKRNIIIALDEIDSHQLAYHIKGTTNASAEMTKLQSHAPIQLAATYPTLEKYRQGYEYVRDEILNGNSYLVNYTLPSRVSCTNSLDSIFINARAKYKLRLQNIPELSSCVVFSPETFITITETGKILSYPVKGTLDADRPNAREHLLENEKEAREHATIVDLIRNDLSIVSTKVRVTKFRETFVIKTTNKNLLQMYSEIEGTLPQDFSSRLGSIIFELLPAGSITGAPKLETVRIINAAERYDRGLYTGIFGIFDGKQLESSVMIRFIEEDAEGRLYKSGGGITATSTLADEYQELQDKVYIPIKEPPSE